MDYTTETHYPYSRYLEETFGGRTYKVVIASGLTCPVRCAFCDLRGSSSYFGKQGRGRAVREQIEARLPEVAKRFSATKFLAYFQSYTNTTAPVDELADLYEQALSVPGIEGLCIGTRPDCIPDPVLELLESIARRRYISLELGIQSFEDPALEWLGRGHDRACSLDALERLARIAPSVHVCAHLIFGTPVDSPSVARDSALLLNRFPVRGTKLHQLMILRNSELAERYAREPFPVVGLPRYCEQVLEFVEHLSPSIYLERLCATATHSDECIAPDWSRDRWVPHNEIRNYLIRNGCKQGAKAGTTL